MIRHVRTEDVQQICEIYNHFILHTFITFEEEEVREEEMKKRIEQVTTNYPWLVYEEDQKLIGYAYATQWRTRSAYRYATETTIYLNPKYKGRGLGYKLYEALVNTLKKSSVHTLIGGIALPNNASIALHEKLGFKKVAHFTEVGYKLNQWIDVGYWELILPEKKS